MPEQPQHRHRHHTGHHHRRKAAMTGAAVGAGAGVAAAPFLNGKAGQLAEEVLPHIPRPMLAGLAAGVVIGAPVGYLWRAEHTPSESHAARIVAERDQVDGLRR